MHRGTIHNIWYQVETAKGKTGYILSDYLSVPETELIDSAAESGVKMQLSVKASCADYNGAGKNWTQYYEWNELPAKALEFLRFTVTFRVKFYGDMSQ